MLTTCPECHTTFRVANDQLETRRGLVRCGYCRAVFNAYDTLLPEFESPTPTEANESPVPGLAIETPPPEPAPTAEVSPEPSSPEPVQPEPISLPGFDALPEFEPLSELEEEQLASEPDQDTEPQPEDVDTPPAMPGFGSGADPFHSFGGDIPRLSLYDEVAGQSDVEPAAEVGPEAPYLPPLLETPDAILLSELPTRANIEPKPQPWKGVLLGLFSVILVLALIGQAAYFFRGAIVQWQPSLRPAFEQACQSLGCEVPLSREVELLKVESSSLETDPEQPNHAKLKVSFSNRSPQAQDWPCFVLRLSDVQGAPLAQRVFWPKDYLPKTTDLKAGMAPMSEQEFRLDLDLTGLTASGYEIKPRYP